MKRNEISIAELETLLDRFGSDLSRFPEPERTLARRLVGIDGAAANLLERQRESEALLFEMQEIEPSPNLSRRVFEIPAAQDAKREAQRPVPWNVAYWWRTALAAAFMLGMGGISGWLTTNEDSTAEFAAEESSEEDGEDWDELSELALAAELTEEW